MTVILRLQPKTHHNGVERLLRVWLSPGQANGGLESWPSDFSDNIIPAPCHSHNDYWRKVPLYEAISAGCIGIEADLWLTNLTNLTNLTIYNNELYVGHDRLSLRPDRTFTNLYIKPLLEILEHQNTPELKTSNAQEGRNIGGSQLISARGVYSSSSDTSLILMLDLKTDATRTWPLIHTLLEPLRKRDWLTYWSNETGVVSRPVTVVGSGLTEFEIVTANTTHRDIFFDAPLDHIEDSKYTRNNSVYASTSLRAAVGSALLGRLSDAQARLISAKASTASEKGLLARYWDTPSWPIMYRNRVWSQLVALGVGVLSVDDLAAAAYWDWTMCTIGGITLCG
jgi:hypothetical protein